MKYIILGLLLASCARTPVTTNVKGNYDFEKSGSEVYLKNEKDGVQYFYWITRENDVLEEKLKSAKLDLLECKATLSSSVDLSAYNPERPYVNNEIKVVKDNFTVQETTELNDLLKKEIEYQKVATANYQTLKTDLRTCHREEAKTARMKWDLEKKQTKIITSHLKKKGRSIAQEEATEEPAPVYEPDNSQQYEESVPQERQDPVEPEPNVENNDY